MWSEPTLLMSPGLLPVSLVLFKREGNDMSWSRLKERFRLYPIFEPPPYLPSFIDPRVELDLVPSEFLGAPIRDNGWILLWWVALLLLSSLCRDESATYVMLRNAAGRGGVPT